LSIVLEITDDTHDCCGQHCSPQTMPTSPCTWLTMGPVAVPGGTPGSILRSIACAKAKPIHYAHYCVMWDVPWPEVIEGAGDVTVEFKTAYGVAAGSELAFVHLCLLDNHIGCGCQTPCWLGSSADQAQQLASNTTYLVRLVNPNLPGGSGLDTVMFIFTFRGPEASGYAVPFRFRGQATFEGWRWRSRVSLGVMHRTAEVLAG